MNPARYIHSATWSRHTATTSAGKRVTGWSAGVSFSCLVEALPGAIKQAIIGHLPQARYRLTTSTEIRENDRIVWDSREFVINEIIPDTTRPTGPYYTGILSQKTANGS